MARLLFALSALSLSLTAMNQQQEADSTKMLLEVSKQSGIAELFVDNLLNEGANINGHDTDGNTPLINFVRSGYSLPMIRFLVSKGANVNSHNSQEETVLFSVMRRRDQEAESLIEVLVEAGVDAEHYNNKSKKALHYAANGAISIAYAQAVAKKSIKEYMPVHEEKRRKRNG